MKLNEIHIKGADGAYAKADGAELEACDSPRQISLADGEALSEARRLDGLCTRRFKANFITAGLDYTALAPGSRLTVGTAVLEISAHKKHCFRECALFKNGKGCPLSFNCAFARVVSAGAVRTGDEIILREPRRIQTVYRIAIITASDKGSRGEREDVSGKVIGEMCEGFAEVASYEVLPDEREMLAGAMRKICDEDGADIIFTTGGTGFSPRDVTPEATADVIERLAPGIPEAMRAKSLQITDRAMLTRAAAGIRKKTLIVNLPGSPKAVRECLEVILPALGHGIDILRGNAGECAR